MFSFRSFLLLLLLSLATVAQAQVGVLQKALDIELEDADFGDLIDAIEAQTELNISYDNNILPDKSFDFSFEQVPLKQILDETFVKSGIEWDLKGNMVVLKLADDAEGSGQKFHVISGYVEDAETFERLVGVQVFDLISGAGTLTNESGFFSLRLRQDSVKIVISTVGYKIYGERMCLKTNVRRIIRLKNDLALETVVITDEDNLEDIAASGGSVIRISMDELEKIPSLMGQSDVISMLKLYPGVSSGTDGSQGFYVRGGGPDQNLILLDGATVYNAAHLFGFFSIFNSDAIKDVKLVKGGFPARYGGRLSSVVDIQTKSGDLESWGGTVNIGVIAAKGSISGPIVKGKTSLLVSARRTLLEPFFFLVNKAAIPQNGNRLGYSFYDLQGKLQHVLGPKDRLMLSGYFGGDRFASGYAIDTNSVVDKFDFQLKWGNSVGSLQWRHEWHSKLFSQLSLLGSNYSYNSLSVSDLSFGANSRTVNRLQTSSSVRDLGMRWAFDWMPDNHQWIRMGIASTAHQFVPETYQQAITNQQNDSLSTDVSQARIRTLENMAWFEDQVRLGKVLQFNLGLNFSNYLVDSSRFWSLQPRASARLSLPHRFGFQASYSDMVQYIHLLSNSGLGLPTDLWVPATGTIPPQQSRQYAVGLDKQVPRLGLTMSVETYLKQMRNLIDYQTGVNFLANSDWQDVVEKGGRGWAYGLEVLLRKETGKFRGWVGYTLSKTERQFSNINFGEIYPYKYDRRHDFSSTLIWTLNDRMELSGTWTYGTGAAITFPEGVYYAPSSPLLGFWDLNQGQDLDVIIDYGNRNNFKLPAYHRLDLNFRLHKKFPTFETFWNFGIFNVYNRRNPYFLFLRADYSGNQNSPEIKVRRMSLLPILPEVNFGLKF